MKSQLNFRQSAEFSSPDPNDQASCLTKEQRAFARVVGQALAGVWQRKRQSAAKQSASDSPEHASLSQETG